MKRQRTPIISPRNMIHSTPIKYIKAKKVVDPEKNFIQKNKSNISLTKYETLPLTKKI